MQKGLWVDCKETPEPEGSVPINAPYFNWEPHSWKRAAEKGKGVLPRGRGMVKLA